MYREHTVGVVIPAYNEEEYVGNVIDSIPAFVDHIYVVDDASTDDTWAVVRQYAGGDEPAESTDEPTVATDGSRVVPIRHEENRGAGGALKTGYQRALAEGMDVTVTLDADGQMDPELMPRFLDPIVEGEADYTKGDRLASPDHRAGMPRFRLAGNLILTYLTRIASGYWGLRDPQNGYTAISRDALDAVDVDELYEYYGYCNELLVRLRIAGMRVADVAMPAKYGDEESNIDYGTYIQKVSGMLFRNFLRRLYVQYVGVPPSPVATAYGTGAAAGLAGLLGGVRAGLFGSDGNRASGARALGLLAVGALATLTAMALDRRANGKAHATADPEGGDER